MKQWISESFVNHANIDIYPRRDREREKRQRQRRVKQYQIIPIL